MEHRNRVGRFTKIAGVIITLIGLLLGSGFFYKEIWHVPKLTCTLLPSYQSGTQASSGLIIENRGRAPCHKIDIIISNLPAIIEEMKIPKFDERYEIVEGGENSNYVIIHLERLTPNSSIRVHLFTSEPIALVESETLSVTSEQGRATIVTSPGVLFLSGKPRTLPEDQIWAIIRPRVEGMVIKALVEALVFVGVPIVVTVVIIRYLRKKSKTTS